MPTPQPIDDFTIKKAMTGLLVIAILLIAAGGAGKTVFWGTAAATAAQADTNAPTATLDAETAGQSIAAGAAIVSFWNLAWQKSRPFLKTMILKFLSLLKRTPAGANVNAPPINGNAS